ncbi:MAG: hypothetical protein HQM11_12115 [SAR324 cluster bacterium]|nr:hypothetical protein [SAR324 cluster bacterium]
MIEITVVQSLIPIAGLSINVISQFLCMRYLSQGKLLRSLKFGFLVGAGGGFVLNFSMMSHLPFDLDVLSQYGISLITYIALGYGYFHFINLGETARRVRLTRELLQSKNGLTHEELLQRYNAQEIIEKRLGRLLRKRQIQLENNRYYIRSKTMLSITRLLVMLKQFVLGKSIEFEDSPKK